MRQVDAALDSRPARLAQRGPVHAQRQVGGRAQHVAAGAHPQPRGRLHLPGLQPDRRPHRLRERRAAAHLPRHARGGAQEEGAGLARARRHGAPDEALPGPALGRPAAARRGGARGGGRPLDPARRRAHRQPRLDQRRAGDGSAARAAPRRRHSLHGDPRPALCRATPSAPCASSTARSSRIRSRPRRSRTDERRASEQERAKRAAPSAAPMSYLRRAW